MLVKLLKKINFAKKTNVKLISIEIKDEVVLSFDLL